MSTFPTRDDIERAKLTTARDNALRAWLGKGNSYKPEELPAHIVSPSNEDRSHAERVLFFTCPLQAGDSYTAYLTRTPVTDATPRQYRITTWMGETLAEVTSITTRRARGWMTDECGSFWARGIDGRIYYGTHNGSGMYCRMRLSKRQPK